MRGRTLLPAFRRPQRMIFLGMRTLNSREAADGQRAANSYFEKAASYWSEVYERDDDMRALIYQERLRILLELVKRIGLPSQERVLDVGCGAGQAAVALA